MTYISCIKVNKIVKRFILFSVCFLSISLGPLRVKIIASDVNDFRSQFPGRRVGGGTRGECSARYLAHIVNPDSIFSPGKSGLLAILQGPSTNPKALITKFGIYNLNQESEYISEIRLKHPKASLFIIPSPKINSPIIWSSSYDCQTNSAEDLGILNFVEDTSPPALSLLLNDSPNEYLNLQKNILKFSSSCSSSVKAEDVFSAFSLQNTINKNDWPLNLDVKCY